LQALCRSIISWSEWGLITVDEIKDSRLYDFLAEKAEQDEPDETFYDEAMDFAMEMERDMYDRD
jgi:hypothetical protein